MRWYLLIISLLLTITLGAQSPVDGVIKSAYNYHQALVNKDIKGIDFYAGPNMRYTHSNGWMESKREQIENIKTGYLNYHSFQEDSLRVFAQGKKAQLQFNARIDVTLNGNRHTYQLRVKENWKRKNNHWYLLARQATKME